MAKSLGVCALCIISAAVGAGIDRYLPLVIERLVLICNKR